MPQLQSHLKRIIQSIQNMFGFQVCIKRKSTSVNATDEKLLNMFNELTVGISEVFDDERRTFEEFLRCDRVSCKINVLNEQIGQVRILYSLWKSGYDLDPEDITTKCQSLNLLVDCIRDDVFYAYLRMPPEQKLELLRKNKQVSSIFSVLGSLENEVTDMVKTMLPNGEIMKVIRPLLKPKFNKVLFRRCAQTMMDCNTPHYYQTIQFCCKGLPFEKPTKVDACTDPIDAKEWGKLKYVPTDAYGDSFYGKPAYGNKNFDDFKKFNIQVDKNSQLTLGTRSPFEYASEKLLPMSEPDNQVAGRLSNQNFVAVDRGIKRGYNESSNERLSIITDVDDIVDVCSNGSYVDVSYPIRSDPDFSGRKNVDVRFWKLAAELIAENPVLD